MRPVVSSEKIFSIARGYKFEARDESGVEQFEVNTLDETSRACGGDGNKLHDLPEISRTYT
jgi:hypothetical protein